MSYNTYPQKWGDPTFGTPSGEIEWSMNLSSGLRIASGYDRQDLEDATRAAFDRWEEVAGLDFTEVSSGADVTISTGLLSGSTVGQANWGGYPSYNYGRITMDTEPLWSPNGGFNTTDFYAVMLHEIGHVIGLDHVNDTSEIMNGYISTSDLGDGDIAGAQYMYGAAVGSGPAPSPAPSPSPGPSPVPSPGPSTSDPDDSPGPSLDIAPSGGDDDDGGSGGAIFAILGLIGLVFGAIFGLGGGGVALAAAATAGPEEEEPEADDEDMTAKACGHDGPCDCGHDHSGEGFHYVHNVYVSEADLVAAEGEDWMNHDHGHGGHDHSHGGCDHDGPCDCDANSEMTSADVVMLTDIIPVTGTLSEHTCGLTETEDVEEEDLLDYV